MARKAWSLAAMLIGLSLLGVGCSSLEKVASRRAADREFRVRTVWVRSALAQKNEGYRKINRGSPVFAGDLLLTFNSIDGLVAYDRDGGFERWRLSIKNGIEGGAGLIRDRLFFGTGDGQFYAVHTKSGQVLWTYAAKAEVLSEPFVDGDEGMVYFLTATNVVHALEADSGKVRWLYTRPDGAALSVRGGSRPTRAGDRVFVGFNDGYLVALEARSGRLIWELSLNRQKRFKDIDTTPVVDGDRVFVAGYDDKLYAVSAEKGEVLWRHDGGGYAGLTLTESRLYYPTSGGEIRALDLQTGRSLWTHRVDKGIATALTPYRGLLVYGESRGFLKFLDPQTGKTVGQFEPGRGVFSTPRVDEKNQRVYFISNEANVYSLEAGWAQRPGIPYLAR